MSVGVEEEFFLVDPVSRRAMPKADAVREHVGRLPSGAKVQPELLSTQVEFSSGVCTSLPELREQLVAGRRAVATAAKQEGLRVISSGTAVLPAPAVPVTDGERFARIASLYREVVTDYQVSGCHVHVGVSDRDTAVAVINHLSVWLPTLLALSASSPFHNGRDTGYASWRMVLQSRFPGSGLTPWFGSAADHDHTVDRLVDMGVLVDSAMTFWLARPSPHYPTVEVRVADAMATVTEAVLQAELTMGLVNYALAELAVGREARPIPEPLRTAAVWNAARYGMDGPAIDLRTGQTVSARWLLTELTELLELPHIHVRQRITGDPSALVDALMEEL